VFVPENEQGVFYLFCKYHEQLGFERILKVNADMTPDIVAECGGKEVRIELEYDLKGLAPHYLVYGRGSYGKWRWDQKYGLFLAGPHHDLSEDELKSFAVSTGNDEVKTQIKKFRFRRLSGRLNSIWGVSDPKQLLRVNYMGSLVYKSLKTVCDCVICWKKDNVKFHDPQVDLIVLKNRLKQLRLF
jgi:hypothetical protein